MHHLQVAEIELLEKRHRPPVGIGVVPPDGGVVDGGHHAPCQPEIDEVLPASRKKVHSKGAGRGGRAGG